MHVNEEWLRSWETIIDQVDKEHVPIDCVKKMIVYLPNRKRKTINIQKLKQQGLNQDALHTVIDQVMENAGTGITNIEFVLDIKAVADLLQPETDKLLRGLT